MEKGKREKRNEREENDEKVENMIEGLNYNCNNPQVPNFGFIVFESTECVERALAAKPIMLYGNHRYFQHHGAGSFRANLLWISEFRKHIVHP